LNAAANAPQRSIFPFILVKPKKSIWRRDDGEEIWIHKGFSEEVQYRVVLPTEDNSVWIQRSVEGVSPNGLSGLKCSWQTRRIRGGLAFFISAFESGEVAVIQRAGHEGPFRGDDRQCLINLIGQIPHRADRLCPSGLGDRNRKKGSNHHSDENRKCGLYLHDMRPSLWRGACNFRTNFRVRAKDDACVSIHSLPQ
jgi:hypothetical protein